MPEVNTFNIALVGMQGDNIVVLNPVACQRMTKEDALVHAAWIVTLVDADQGRWEEVLEAVQST